MNDFSGTWGDTQQRIALNADKADLSIGGNGLGGDIKLKDDANVTTIYLDAGGIEAPEPLAPGSDPKKVRVLVSGATGGIEAGGYGKGGSLMVKNAAQTPAGWIFAGTTGGALALHRADGKQGVYLSGSTGDLSLGGNGAGGEIKLYESNDVVAVEGVVTPPAAISLSATNQTITLSASSESAGIAVKNEMGNKVILLVPGPGSGPAGPGGPGFAASKAGRIVLNNWNEQTTVILDGGAGDIVLKNADCAEDFDVSGAADVPRTEPPGDQATASSFELPETCDWSALAECPEDRVCCVRDPMSWGWAEGSAEPPEASAGPGNSLPATS